MVVRKNREQRLRRPPQVFVVDAAAIAAGMPAERKNSVYLFSPDRDFTLENEYLLALANGKFADFRRDEPVEWMGNGRVRKHRIRSLKTTAGAVLTARQWLDEKGISFLEVTEAEVEDVGADLEAAGLDGGTIGQRQSAMLHCAQWAVWQKLRPPLKIHSVAMRISWQQDGNAARSFNAPKIIVMKKRAPQLVEYLTPAMAARVVSKVPDRAYRIAIRLMFGSGLRPFEPGMIDDAAMPRSPSATATPTKFAVIGKGLKKRFPEVDDGLLRDINDYRLHDRPDRVKKYERRHGRAPDQLLLNAKNGNLINYWGVYHAFKKACEVAGIEAKPQWARHSFACNRLADFATSQLLLAQETGATIAHGSLDQLLEAARVELMVLMGHASFSTSAVYLARVRAAVTDAITRKRHLRLERTS
jgi:site-specific recombinase XerD